MASEQDIEEGVVIGNVAIASDARFDLDAQSLDARPSQIADVLRNLYAEHAHAEIVEQRHVAAIAKPEIENIFAGIGRFVGLVARIVTEQRPHNELYRVNVDGVAFAIEGGVMPTQLIIHRARTAYKKLSLHPAR